MPNEADDGAGRAADASGERLAVLEQLESWRERPMAPLATFFVGRSAADGRAELAGWRSIEALRRDIAALRAELRP